jgi:hypothetical protein
MMSQGHSHTFIHCTFGTRKGGSRKNIVKKKPFPMHMSLFPFGDREKLSIVPSCGELILFCYTGVVWQPAAFINFIFRFKLAMATYNMSLRK